MAGEERETTPPEDEAPKEETPEEEKSTEKAGEESPAPIDKIKKATEVADRLDKANDRYEALILKQEALKVEKTLGGKTEAGTEKKEETDKDYKERVMSGEA